MKKAIFFDIDGTISTEDERSFIPESAVRAIKTAREKGNLVFINTGRTLFSISNRIIDIGFDGYLCGCGTYIEYKGEVLLHKRLNSNFCRSISDLIQRCHANPVYERSDSIFFDKASVDHPGVKYIRKIFLSELKNIERTSDEEDFSFDKFVVWTDEYTDKKTLFTELNKYFDMIDRGEGLYEAVPHGFSKATAVEAVLSRLGISPENAYALGDSMNDLAMLKAVPNSIAMGGAEKLYPYVSFVTKPVEEDGVEFALKHFGII